MKLHKSLIIILSFTISSLALGIERTPTFVSQETQSKSKTAKSVQAVTQPNVQTVGTANELAEAMDIPLGDILSASYLGSDTRAFGRGDKVLGRWFPVEGNTFAVISTGLASYADQPNNEEGLTSPGDTGALDGSNN